MSGTQTVRYGGGSSFVTKSVTGSGACTNAFFGSDPLFGVVKRCEAPTTALPPPSWALVAVEGQSFNLSGTQTVRYASGSSWITRSQTGSGQCTTAWFGNDPLVGVVKRCEVFNT